MAKVPIPFVGGGSATPRAASAEEARVAPPFYAGEGPTEAAGVEAEEGFEEVEVAPTSEPVATSDLETQAATDEPIAAPSESPAMETAEPATMASEDVEVEEAEAAGADEAEDEVTVAELAPPATEPWALAETEADTDIEIDTKADRDDEIAGDEIVAAEAEPADAIPGEEMETEERLDWDAPTVEEEEPPLPVGELETSDELDEIPRYTPLEAAAEIWGEDTGEPGDQVRAGIEAAAVAASLDVPATSEEEVDVEEEEGDEAPAEPGLAASAAPGVGSGAADRDEDAGDIEAPDFLFGADGADLGPASDDAVQDAEAPGEGAARGDLESELEGEHGIRIRDLINELEGEGATTDEAVRRAFAAGYLAARKGQEEK